MNTSQSNPGIFSNLGSFVRAISILVIPIGGTVLIGYWYGWLLEDFIVSDMVYVYAAFPTIFSVNGLAKITHGFGGRRVERGAIQKALSNRPPTDGEVYAFIGTLEPDGDVLTAPFSGKDCILYEYSLSKWVHGGRQQSSYTDIWFSGFHLCPAHINTIRGPVALHVYPAASGFVSNIGMAPPLKQSITYFVEHTNFKDAGGLNYVAQVGESFALLTKDVDPPVSIDVSFTKKRDLESLDIDEEYVPPGVDVCLITKYDAGRQAAVWYSGVTMSALDQEHLKKLVRGSWVRGVVWGLLFLSLGLGIGILPLGPSSMLDKLGSPGASMLERRASHLWSAINADSMPLAWHLVSIMEPDARDEEGRTLLMSAANDPGVARQLLERGADPNAVDNFGKTALLHAIRLDVAKVLLEYGADASILTGGHSARLFFTAISELDTEGVSLFLKNGISPDYWSANGEYPLLLAVKQCVDDRKGRAHEIVRMLLREGSKIGNRDENGSTALELATRHCDAEMVSLLSNAARQK